jgi:hypothetical protein
MCITLLVASLVTTAAGTAAGIANAKYQAGMMKLQLDEQREQMRQEQKNLLMQAQEEELARLEEYRRNREASLLAMAASGVGQNMSFFQGIEKANERNLRRDLANIRLGFLEGNNRIAQQIRVNRTQLEIAQAEKRSAIFGSVLKGIGSAIDAGNVYNMTRTPKPKQQPKPASITVESG